jgi:cyclic pyranopterin phosphate synthase
MPQGNVEFQEAEKLLSYDQLLKIVTAVMPLGIHNFRITGGEPLVRSGIVEFIQELKALDPQNKVFLTTNGVLLNQHLDGLVKAGLDGVNVSLCSTDAREYEMITGSNQMETVREAILAAANSGIRTKVNCVPLLEWNEDQLTKVASLAKDNRIDVRFIEMMPIGLGSSFGVITGADVLSRMEAVYGSSIPIPKRGNGPATYVRFENFTGDIGFINARTCAFCKDCNRTRLTANGFLKLCLNYETGIDVLEAIKNNSSPLELTNIIEKAIYVKPVHHNFIEGITEMKSDNLRYMSQIGG